VVAIHLATLDIENRFAMGPDSGPGCIIWVALK
jgi:hypothetical protein